MKTFPAALALAVALSGCTLPSPLEPSPAVRYYVLSSPAPRVMKENTPRIGVIPVTLPGYLARPQLVVREGDGVNITVNDFDRWGESLGQGVARVLCDTLAAEGQAAIPLRTGARVKDRLMLDIRRLDGPLKGQIALDAVWTLQRDGVVLRSGHTVKSRPAGNSLEEVVEAQSLLVQDLAREIAGNLH